jgi:hypothetical protein
MDHSLSMELMIDDAKLKVVCKFRSRQRLPAVVWQHPVTKATLSRCAQPLPGLVIPIILCLI